jgi:hypothetical protein
MLVHDDRPDFILVATSSRTGIEHAEVVPENVARASFLRSKGHGPDMYFTPRATFGEDRKTAQQLKDEIALDEPGDGWVGDTPEKETAAAIVGFAQRKSATAHKQGYRLFDRNWLMLYNNWPGPAVKLGKSVSVAHPALLDQKVFDTFEYVFVLDSLELAILSAGYVQIVALVDPGLEG